MALTAKSCIKLNDGHTLPVIGFGTFAPPGCPKDEARTSTECAIEMGYRLIDCAAAYMNEPEVGQGIRAKIADGTVKREDIFYTGKLWNTHHTPERVRPALEKSLKDLQLDYMDLFLIHTPIGFEPGDNPFPKDEHGKLIFHKTDFHALWKAMEECKDAGLTRSIGISNFNHHQVEKILKMPGLKYKPACMEMECHIYHNQSKLLEFCKKHDIAVCAYAVLGSSRAEGWLEDKDCPRVLEDPVLNKIAKKVKRTAAQVAIRFVLQKGVCAIMKSFNPQRIKENFEVFDFELSEEDMKALHAVDKGLRYFGLKHMMNLWLYCAVRRQNHNIETLPLRML